MNLIIDGKRKFAMMFLTAFLVFGVNISRAEAAEVLVNNTLDNPVSLAFCYTDRSTGLWTTAGWYTVEGNTTMKIIIYNVDPKPVFYYAARNGNLTYVDKGSIQKTTTAWVVDDIFKFEGEGKPKTKQKNLRVIRFYGAKKSNSGDGYSIRIDTRPVG
ncbi:MAG: DUF1036 domain-containing protein [Deltaproteobacteria bacterium]|jgi:uncharacterized membrane protein|nr:DUF1036 domain-containing protein [Deltaproteobacteria bacterium]